MIGAVERALTHIYSIIPTEILEAAFKPYEYNLSLDSLIVSKILLGRVRDDISLRGGKILKIILNQNWCEYTSSPSPYALGQSGAYTVFCVPPEARDNRDISCVLGVRFPYTLGTSNSCSFYNNDTIKGNTLSGLACAALQAQTGANQLSTPNAYVLPGNMIKLDPPQYNFVPWQVTTRLVYDDNFSGMDVSSIRPFCLLCEYATKAYIYTNLIVSIESNLVVKGVELGIIKDTVSGYQDANEKYEEQLIAMGGAQMYEPDRLRNILLRMVPKR